MTVTGEPLGIVAGAVNGSRVAITPAAHMHVGWLALVNLHAGTDSLDVEALRATVGRRLHHAPRFRQRVQSAPLGEPFLRDDPDFDVAQHITEAPRRVMPARELGQACDRFLSLRARANAARPPPAGRS